jgi:hypothetical protein
MENFSHENEVRAVIKIPLEIPTGALNRNTFKVKHRYKEGLIIPYIEMNFDKRSVEEVRIGPMLSNTEEIAKSTVIDFLAEKEYRNVGVIASKIPVRF